MLKPFFLVLLSLFFVCILSGPAFAFMNIPVATITLQALLYSLVPVIFLEAIILKKRLDLSFKKGLKTGSLMNVVSTLIVFPVMTIAHLNIAFYLYDAHGWGRLPEIFYSRFLYGIWNFIAEMAFIQSTMFKPSWYLIMPAVFSMFILFPGVLFIEYLVVRWMVTGTGKRAVRNATLQANLISFGILTPINAFILYICSS